MGIALLLASCSAEESDQPSGVLSFSTSIENFEGESVSTEDYLPLLNAYRVW